MSEEKKPAYGKHLSAKELLRNKGIRFKAWNEWEESSRALPKIGSNKQFEPNGSWLQSKQIEKGLKSREFLLGIERVERSSQLASAEWLPEQKRARVTKKTGTEWANFGHEINSNLYLIAEEALILLETECLELIWEGIPLSIQQAYEVLIESEGSDCTLSEYRVYSQLTRLGYRLQRFYYEKSELEKSRGTDEPIQRKKVIVDPENGLWMAGKNIESAQSSGYAKKPEIDNDVKEIVENIVVTINGNTKTDNLNDKSHLSTEVQDSTDEKVLECKTKNGKVEIISEQTIVAPIKIVKDGTLASEHGYSKWPGARIQRNVKLLPKRNDKGSLNATATETPTVQSKYEISERRLDKRKYTQTMPDSPEIKKLRHEVIELSDDEIEEIPRPMSRMEMLNCLPNIAEQVFITENISKRYIPRGVRPQSTYRYDSRKLRRMHEVDKTKRRKWESARNGTSRNVNENDSSSQRNAAVVPYQQYSRYPSAVLQNNSHRSTNSQYVHNVNHFTANSMLMNAAGGVCMQQVSLATRCWQNQQTVFNRWSSYQMNLFRNAAAMGSAMRSVFMQNAYHTNFHQNAFHGNQQFHNRPHRYLDRSFRGSYSPRFRGTMHERPQRHSTPNSQPQRFSNQQSEVEIYEPTFTKVPGVSSWPELKQKWRDARTITIDDEDLPNCNEIQVVDQSVKPLVSAKNTRNLAEIYEKLRIIKSAPDRTVRRKKSDFKISYNVYSSTQHYRKTNPGLPMFHLVITSQKENVLLQPVELNRLQQDGKGASIIFAHVTNSSIAYIQPGIISLPNLL